VIEPLYHSFSSSFQQGVGAALEPTAAAPTAPTETRSAVETASAQLMRFRKEVAGEGDSFRGLARFGGQISVRL
jgi:hypothetical protein